MLPLAIREKGAVVHLELQRPAARHALSVALVEALRDAVQALPATVRVVVVHSRGPTFCAGGDLQEMAAAGAADPAANRAQALALAACFTALAEAPQVSVARVQGAALGGGAGLCAACDLVVASEAAEFCFSEVRLGLVPATIAPWVVRRLGLGPALRLFLTAERLCAADAAALGWVHKVVPAAQLDAAVTALCGQLLRGGPQALRVVKLALPTLLALPAAAQPRAAAELLAEVREGTEAQEGIAAFFARRPASFVAS